MSILIQFVHPLRKHAALKTNKGRVRDAEVNRTLDECKAKGGEMLARAILVKPWAASSHYQSFE